MIKDIKTELHCIQVIGSLVAGSGFEDTVYESGLCTSGSLHGALAGTHYNRAWHMQSAFSEALERLFLTRFLTTKKPEIPAILDEITMIDLPENLTIDDSFSRKYELFRESARTGALGKTAQFWLLYMDLMRYQVMAHTAIQENDFETLVYCWKQFIPMYFVMNKRNYARCTSSVFYLE